jgi:hypothetical protein
MMLLARRASLGVVLLLLASAGTASAECAWLLRSEGRTSWVKNHVRWGIETGVEPAEACREAARERLARLFEANRDRVIATGPMSISAQADGQPEGRTINITFRCLSDTVDPRGPKEK